MTSQQRQQRLLRLGDFARQEEDKAARRMTDARARLDDQEQRLSLLEGYQREYASRLSFNTGASGGVFALLNYRAFMARIDEAVGQQRGVVERVRQEHAALTRHWNEQRTRTRGLGKVGEKLSSQIARDQQQRDQRVQDEFSARLSPSLTLND